MGIWRVTRSTWLQNLAVRSFLIFNGTPSGIKLIGTCNKKGMKFASKFNGTLVVKSQLFKLVKGALSITGPANTQKDGGRKRGRCEFGMIGSNQFNIKKA
eukprot:1160955-Pelagomonas_calceolata.AAC.6